MDGMKSVRARCAWLLLLISACPVLHAAELRVAVIGADETPVAGVAVVVDLDGAFEFAPAQQPGIAVMDQIDEQFVPDLLVIQAGSRVEFPNSDAVLHHVYSFSAAKQFELPLFHGRVHSPVVFDEPGLVVVGCNIHDHMVGHILVVESPLHGVTDERGVVTFKELPEANYRVEVFRPDFGFPAESVTFGSTRIAAQRELSIRVPGRRELMSNEALAWEDY
jgi:plastocyanin